VVQFRYPEHLDCLDKFDIGAGSDGIYHIYGTRNDSLKLDHLFAIAHILPNLKHEFLENIVIKPVSLPASLEPIVLDVLSLVNAGTLDGADIFTIIDVFRLEKADLNIFARPCDGGAWLVPSHAPRGLTASKWHIFSLYSKDIPILQRLVDTSFTEYVQSLDIDSESNTTELKALINVLEASDSL
jgi:hypothetical protein